MVSAILSILMIFGSQDLNRLKKQSHQAFFKGKNLHALVFLTDIALKVGKNELMHCAGYPLVFYPSGQIKQIFSKNSFSFPPFAFRKMDWIFFYPDGQIQAGSAEKNTTVEMAAHKICIGTNPLTFHAGGSLKSASLCVKQRIDGIDYLGMNEGFAQISFHPNGQIHTGFLAENTRIGDITFYQGRFVRFDQDGKLTGGTLAYDQKIGNKVYSGLSWYELEQVSFVAVRK